MPNVTTNWYVIHTFPQHEKKIHAALVQHKIENYLPLKSEIRQWSDRRKKLEVPLFPNYLFVKINLKERHRVVGIPGVLKFLSTGSKPSIILERDIDLIKKLAMENIEVTDEYINLNDIVMITSGPLKGVTGLLVYRKGNTRLLVEIDGIKKSVLVEISPEMAKRISVKTESKVRLRQN